MTPDYFIVVPNYYYEGSLVAIVPALYEEFIMQTPRLEVGMLDKCQNWKRSSWQD